MLSTEAAGLAIKIAKGLIKVTSRIDVILAEKEAVKGPLALPIAEVGLSPTQPRMRRALRRLLSDTDGAEPDPLGTDRDEILDTVENHPEKRALLFEFMQRYLPEQALGRQLDLNSDFLTALREARPDLASDPDLRITAFYISSGEDHRNKDYSWRIALTVVDVLAEFGSENMSLFTRNEEIQSVAGSVLQRFAKADVQETDSTQDLLRAALSATLNGALDARAGYGARNPWIDSVLDALLVSRETLPAEQQENYVAGLLRGNGYPLLVATVLDMGAGELDDDNAGSFKKVAVDVLGEVAGIVRQKPGFERFFNDHWGDILRAGVVSVQHRGPALLNNDPQLLSRILIAVVNDLSTRPNSKLLPDEIIVAIVDATIGSVAVDPALIDDALDKPWLMTFISSVVASTANKGIRGSFTRKGLETMVKNTLGTFADHPELIIGNPGLAGDLLQGVLKPLSSSGALVAEDLASAAIDGALQAIARHPALIDFKYPRLLADLTVSMASRVQNRQITRGQASDILRGLGVSIASNPALFLDTEKRLAGWVVEAVMKVADKHENKLLDGETLVSVVEQVMVAQARSATAALKNHAAESLVDQLSDVLLAGLVRVEAELGNRMSLTAVPLVLGRLIVAWNKGEIATVDPDNDNFRRLFSELADQVAA